MILSNLHVTSFGALASLDIQLKPGLNVILGPNEAGKSTLYRALQHLLLTPVKLNKRSFREQIQPLLPVGGADTVSCTLGFRVGKERYRLEKSWGARSTAELELPGGSRITHVAMYLSNGDFLHAHGCVRVNSLKSDSPNFDPKLVHDWRLVNDPFSL